MTYVYTVLSACRVYVIQQIPGKPPCDAHMRFTMCVAIVLPGYPQLAVFSGGVYNQTSKAACVLNVFGTLTSMDAGL